MNAVDIAILVLVVVSMAEGVRRGGASQLFSYGGLAIGLGMGAILASPAAQLAEDPLARTVISTVVLFGTALLMGAAGRMIGSRVARTLHRAQLGPADAAAGALVSLIATLLVVWLMAGMLATVPIDPLSAGIQESNVIRALNDRLPPTPGVFSRIRQLLSEAGFPQVFEGLEPSHDEDIPLPDDAVLRAAVQAAGQSTVKIVGLGCGGTLSGSGFVAAPNLVITNAHVVAGVDSPIVQDRRGNHRATTVIFDPGIDIAVLRTTRLAGNPLPLNLNAAPKGQSGAVLGFPGGGPFKAVPAAIIDQIDALGRDIYGRRLATRKVYRLRAEVRPGNSGGPIVATNGNVFGVVFSASRVIPDVGYALTARQVNPRLEQAGGLSNPVDTGPCVS